MSNPLYNAMSGAGSANPLQMLSELMTNPIGFAVKRGFNIPDNIPSDPTSITQYLLSSGQISQQYYNDTVQKAQPYRTI